MFATALKMHRERLGLTQAQVGALLPDMDGKPTSYRTVRQWELGQREPPGYAQRCILKALEAVKLR